MSGHLQLVLFPIRDHGIWFSFAIPFLSSAKDLIAISVKDLVLATIMKGQEQDNKLHTLCSGILLLSFNVSTSAIGLCGLARDGEQGEIQGLKRSNKFNFRIQFMSGK